MSEIENETRYFDSLINEILMDFYARATIGRPEHELSLKIDDAKDKSTLTLVHVAIIANSVFSIPIVIQCAPWTFLRLRHYLGKTKFIKYHWKYKNPIIDCQKYTKQVNDFCRDKYPTDILEVIYDEYYSRGNSNG